MPSTLVLTVAFGAMLYYFWRTTGSPLRTPYQVNLQTQDPVPLFPWQSLRPTLHANMRSVFLDGEIEQYNLARSHFVISAATRAIQFYLFFLGPVLILPFLLLAAGTRRRRLNVRLLLTVLSVSAFGLLLPIYYGPSYAAVLTCIVYALLLSAMQRIRRWRLLGKSTGLAIVRAVPVVCVLMLAVRAAAPLPGIPTPQMAPLTWCSPHLFNQFSRERVQAALESKPGLQLALVRHSQDQVEPVDWVQNLADIDRQKVIWANDMGPQQNRELIDYFKARQVWLVEPDKIPPQISPYPTKQGAR